VDARFATTRWSVVLAAGHRTAGGRDSFASLCQSYWFPLYAYVRRRGHPPEDAQDLTQAFFARLIEKNWVDAETPEHIFERRWALTLLDQVLAQLLWSSSTPCCSRSITAPSCTMPTR